MQDELYQWIADQDCNYQPEDEPAYRAYFDEQAERAETLKAMHERLQREIKAEHAAAASKANTDLLLDALGLKS